MILIRFQFVVAMGGAQFRMRHAPIVLLIAERAPPPAVMVCATAWKPAPAASTIVAIAIWVHIG